MSIQEKGFCHMRIFPHSDSQSLTAWNIVFPLEGKQPDAIEVASDSRTTIDHDPNSSITECI